MKFYDSYAQNKQFYKQNHISLQRFFKVLIKTIGKDLISDNLFFAWQYVQMIK